MRWWWCFLQKSIISTFKQIQLYLLRSSTRARWRDDLHYQSFTKLFVRLLLQIILKVSFTGISTIPPTRRLDTTLVWRQSPSLACSIVIDARRHCNTHFLIIDNKIVPHRGKLALSVARLERKRPFLRCQKHKTVFFSCLSILIVWGTCMQI